MSYHPHGFNLSNAQMTKLCKGGSVRVTHSNLNGPENVHLTKTQLNRLNKAHRDKVGMILKLSAPQLKKTISGGSFKSILNKLARIGKNAYSTYAPIARAYAKRTAKQLIPLAINNISNAAKLKLPYIAPGIDYAADYAKRKVDGWGMKPKRGKGLFGSIFKAVAPAGIDLLSGLAKNKIAGNGMKKRVMKRKGNGLFSSVLKAVAPAAIDLGANLLKNKVGGKMGRKTGIGMRSCNRKGKGLVEDLLGLGVKRPGKNGGSFAGIAQRVY